MLVDAALAVRFKGRRDSNCLIVALYDVSRKHLKAINSLTKLLEQGWWCWWPQP